MIRIDSHFAIASWLRLDEHGGPIAGIVPTRDGASFIRRGSRLYELFRYIEGRRYRRTGPQAHASGYEMARMHDQLRTGPVRPPRGPATTTPPA